MRGQSMTCWGRIGCKKRSKTGFDIEIIVRQVEDLPRIRRRSHNSVTVGFSLLLFPSSVTNHVRQHPISTGHARAQLTIPNDAGVDVSAATIICHEQATLQWRFAWLVLSQ